MKLNRFLKQQSKQSVQQTHDEDDVAIVGMSCRFGGGIQNVNEFWESLLSGKDCVENIPSRRWNNERIYSSKPAQGKVSTKRMGFLRDVEYFDHEFFKITQSEAQRMDPQQRLLLEETWSACHDAGLIFDDTARERKTGVFVAIGQHDFEKHFQPDNDKNTVYDATGSVTAIAANRISYVFDLVGPSVAMDTACSSSMVAMDYAVKNIKLGACNDAIVAGINLLLHPQGNKNLSLMGMMAPDGKCKTFDASADGYVRSEGVAAVYITKLSSAIRNQQRVYAVIKATGVNQDGKTATLTAPNGSSQRYLMHATLTKSGLKPNDLSVLECHGTGTKLGDPIEVNSIADVYGQGRNKPLYLTAVKSNIGHTEYAAGLAGFIKLAMILYRRKIAKSLHFSTLNPLIADKISDKHPLIKIAADNIDSEMDKIMYGAVSSFGFGGTNTHVILGSYGECVTEEEYVPISVPTFNKTFFQLYGPEEDEHQVHQLESESTVTTPPPPLTFLNNKVSKFDKLAGKRLSRSSKTVVYHNVFTPSYPKFVPHHVLKNVTIYPAAGFISLFISCIYKEFGLNTITLHDLKFIKAMIFDSHESFKLNVYVELKKIAESEWFAKIKSIDDDGLVMDHCTCEFLEQQEEDESTSRGDLISRDFSRDIPSLTEKLMGCDLYKKMNGRDGNSLLESFQPVANISRNDRLAYTHLELPDPVYFDHIDEHVIHPGFIDYCFTTEMIWDVDNWETNVPVAIDTIVFRKDALMNHKPYVGVYERGSDDKVIYNHQGDAVLQVFNLQKVDLTDETASKLLSKTEGANPTPRSPEFKLTDSIRLSSFEADSFYVRCDQPTNDYMSLQNVIQQSKEHGKKCILRVPPQYHNTYESLVKSLSAEGYETVDIEAIYTHTLEPMMGGEEGAKNNDDSSRDILRGKTFLVTGASGGIGSLLSKYLSKHGASKVIGLSSTYREGVDCYGVDLSNIEQIRALVPQDTDLHGIFHCAGRLHDGFYESQTDESFTKVWQPKADGVDNLLTIANEHPEMEHIVVMSSIASLMGSAGQSNYAYANGYLTDRVLQHPKGRSFALGPWSLGMTDSLDTVARLERIGMYSIHAEDADQVFYKMLSSEGGDYITVVKNDWKLYLESMSKIPILYKHFENQVTWKEDAVMSNFARDLLSQTRAEAKKSVEETLNELIKIALGVIVEPTVPLMDAGLDSLSTVDLRNAIVQKFGMELPSTLLFDYPTVCDLTRYIMDKHLFLETGDQNTNETSSSKDSSRTSSISEPIAIVGMAGRFPGHANSYDELWELLLNKTNCSDRIKADRFDADKFYDPDEEAPGKLYSPFVCAMDNPYHFDHQFFGMSKSESQRTDPQALQAIETSYLALCDAGIEKDDLFGSLTDVYLGIEATDDDHLDLPKEDLNVYSATGTSMAAASGRIAYLFGLKGAAISVVTACSSSLVSVHSGVNSLRLNQSNLVLAGGVNVMTGPHMHLIFSRLHALSDHGKCMSFDHRANGYARGEGCGMIVMERLSDAKKNGRRIHALIKGTAVQQDGRSSTLTAPNGPAQEATIRTALSAGGLVPDDISYIECHGTGTPLGDPIEANAIKSVFAKNKNPLYFGTAKSNIGHLETAAGVTGLIKLTMVLKKRLIPPSINFEKLNPKIVIKRTALRYCTEAIELPKNQVVRGGVSSFGFGGTLGHVILESYENDDGVEANHRIVKSKLTNRVYCRNQESIYLPRMKDTTSLFRLTKVSAPLQEDEEKEASVCFIKTSHDLSSQYRADVANVVFATNCTEAFVEVIRLLQPHQKLFVFHSIQQIDGIKGLFAAFGQDHPSQYGCYVEHEDESMTFPISELRSHDYWVYYDASSHRSVVTMKPYQSNVLIANQVNMFDETTDVVLITGATGGIGSAMTKSLYARGVRRFVIVTRSSKFSPDFVRIYTPNAEFMYHHNIDLTQKDQVGSLFNQYRITGVVHCAGLIGNDTSDKIDFQTYESKVLGAENLHISSINHPLKLFWLCSSISAVWGVGGAYGYCHANAYMDALAERRRLEGLVVTVRQIGPSRGVGMGAGLEKEMERYGLIPLDVDEIAESFFEEPSTNLICCGMKSTFGNLMINHTSLFSSIRETMGNNDKKKDIVEHHPKKTFSPEEIKQEISHIVHEITSTEIALEAPLMEGGMDSISVVEFRNKLQSIFGVKISGTVLFDYPSIMEVSYYVEKLLKEAKTDSEEEDEEEEYRMTYDVVEKKGDMIVVDKLVIERQGYGMVEYMGKSEFETSSFPEILQDLEINETGIMLKGESKYKVPGTGLNRACIVKLEQFTVGLDHDTLQEGFIQNDILLLEYEPTVGRIRIYQENMEKAQNLFIA